MPNVVRFYLGTKVDKQASFEAKREIHKAVEMCEIILAGDKHTRPCHPAHETTVTYDPVAKRDDKRTWVERYPAEYREFKLNGVTAISGTPIDGWELLTRQTRAELKALDILTVEQVADMNERNRAILGPDARELIAKAKDYVKMTKGEDTSELDELRAEIARLKGEADKPRRGRPPKVETEEATA